MQFDNQKVLEKHILKATDEEGKIYQIVCEIHYDSKGDRSLSIYPKDSIRTFKFNNSDIKTIMAINDLFQQAINLYVMNGSKYVIT